MNSVNQWGSLKNKFTFNDHSFTRLVAQDGRVRCPVDGNFEIFLTANIDFCSFLDNVEIIVNKIWFWREK